MPNQRFKRTPAPLNLGVKDHTSMESLIKILLEKYIGGALQALWKLILRIVIAVKKFAFPVKDLRTGIRQSRMRYYRVQFSYRNGETYDAFQEADSNGNVTGYYDNEGERYLPEEPHACSHLDGGKFQSPRWTRTDWRDVFNSNKDSGCWGISEK